mmetsp:Transcript_6348/g.18103  ORF Transcript_6348/g.18103 Transcript_6348/m.18103 type:complete len:233 (-) Transcript_6348:1928-2626(-)
MPFGWLCLFFSLPIANRVPSPRNFLLLSGTFKVFKLFIIVVIVLLLVHSSIQQHTAHPHCRWRNRYGSCHRTRRSYDIFVLGFGNGTQLNTQWHVEEFVRKCFVPGMASRRYQRRRARIIIRRRKGSHPGNQRVQFLEFFRCSRCAATLVIAFILDGLILTKKLIAFPEFLQLFPPSLDLFLFSLLFFLSFGGTPASVALDALSPPRFEQRNVFGMIGENGRRTITVRKTIR